MKTIFILFQADQWQSKKSYVFMGAFDSYERANQAAKDNDLYSYDSTVIIKETTLNEFMEI